MKYWIGNLNSKNVEYYGSDGNYSLRISSRRRINIRRGDFVLLHASGQRLVPLSFRVSDIRQEEIQGHQARAPFSDPMDSDIPDAIQYNYTFSLEIDKNSIEKTELYDFRYSLEFVTRVDQPALHFRQPYRQISQLDYNTLTKGFIFWSRTAFFSLFNALPRPLKLRFNYEEAMREQDRAGREYNSKLKRLFAFVDNRVLAVGRILKQSSEVWHSLRVSEPIQSFENVFFSFDNERAADSAGTQLHYFNELFEILDSKIHNGDGRNLIEELANFAASGDNAASERRFERYFFEK